MSDQGNWIEPPAKEQALPAGQAVDPFTVLQPEQGNLAALKGYLYNSLQGLSRASGDIKAGLEDFSRNVAVPYLENYGKVPEGPLLGVGSSGELTGRLPALASAVAPFIVGAAPPGALGAGSRLPGGVAGGWHGTPHLFEPEEGAPLGRFRNEAIGSGEGAQAYGWGHYVAGNPKVAEGYQEALTGRSAVPSDEQGNPLNYIDIAKKYYEPGSIVPSYGGNFDKVLKFNEGPVGSGQWSVNVKRVVPTDEALASKQKWGELIADPSNWRDHAFDPARSHSTYPDDKELTDIGAARGWQMTKPGALLEVHILPEEHELLDWDKPLSEQPAGVRQKILENRFHEPFGDYDELPPDPTGEMIYRNMSRGAMSEGRSKKIASGMMDEAGIPGIRYLDQGSRGNRFTIWSTNPEGVEQRHGFYDTADQANKEMNLFRDMFEKGGYHPGLSWEVREQPATHNYVIFHPDNLRITARNGQRLEPVDHDPFGGQ